MQLRQGLRVLRRATDEVQVGIDPRWAVRIAGLTAEHADRLVRSRDGRVDDLLPAPTLRALGTAGLLRPAGSRRRRARPDLVAEATAHDLTRSDGDGTEALRRRARATVAVVGLDRLGTTVAATLATAGIGTLLLDDDTPVRPQDVAGPVGAEAVGQRRCDAVAAALRGLVPTLRTRVAGLPSGVGHGDADVVVTAATDATDPATALALLGADLPHLPVVAREADALVGPFVLPVPAAGEPGPCVRCVDLHRADLDPAWPLVLAQLVAPERRATGRGAVGPTAVLAAVAGGLAAAEVLAHVDGGSPRTRGAQYEVALPSAAPRLRRWEPHPGCGCAALPG